MSFIDMNEPILLALAAAFVMAMRDLLGRQAVQSAHPALVSALTAVFALPILACLALLRGDTLNPWPGWDALAIISASGILRITIARTLVFAAIQRIGSARASSLASTSVLFSMLLGTVALHESVTLMLVIGTIAIVLGSVAIARSRGGQTPEALADHSTGIFLALGAALAFAGAAVTARSVLHHFASSVQANLYATGAAALAYAPLLLRRSLASQLRTVPSRAYFLTFLIAAALALGTTLSYAALTRAPVVLIQPITQTRPLFVLALAWLLFRRQERIDVRTIAGAVAIVGGTVLLVRS